MRVITEPGSALPGVNYAPKDKVLVLPAGAIMATIDVGVLPADVWSSSLEFSMRLCEPSDHARITTTHLHRVRCWIIHTGPFPSAETFNVFSSSRNNQMIGFVRWLLRNDGASIPVHSQPD